MRQRCHAQNILAFKGRCRYLNIQIIRMLLYHVFVKLLRYHSPWDTLYRYIYITKFISSWLSILPRIKVSQNDYLFLYICPMMSSSEYKNFQFWNVSKKKSKSKCFEISVKEERKGKCCKIYWMLHVNNSMLIYSFSCD